MTDAPPPPSTTPGWTVRQWKNGVFIAEHPLQLPCYWTGERWETMISFWIVGKAGGGDARQQQS